MKTTLIGREAEGKVAKRLIKDGYKILAQNWRTRVCEVDLIAQKDNIIYFVEVKYRKTEEQGGGLEYITPKKLRQINFAAEVWTQHNKWEGDYQLLAASVSDDGLEIIELA